MSLSFQNKKHIKKNKTKQDQQKSRAIKNGEQHIIRNELDDLLARFIAEVSDLF